MLPKTTKTLSKQLYQFLSFQLNSQIQAILPKEAISEIITLESNQVLPIFDLPSMVKGVYNHRGEILWIVDLASLLGLESSLSKSYKNSYNSIIIYNQNKMLGLAVEQIGQLIVSTEAEIHSSLKQQFSPELAFCVRGEKRALGGKKMLVLEPENIFNLIKELTTK